MRLAERFRPGFWAGLLYLLLVLGTAVLAVRYTRGLGAVTNLSDRFPWGLWVGFDILCGVGLAAGGFAITTVVYVFNLKRFKPIVRPTILTAFLGYSLVVVALLFDLGRPWNIWHPLVMWNPRSVMFEVSWCVTLYLTVLALEFSGMVFERLGWSRALAVQQAADDSAGGGGSDPLDASPVLARGLLPDHARQAPRALVHVLAAGAVLPLRGDRGPRHDDRGGAAQRAGLRAQPGDAAADGGGARPPRSAPRLRNGKDLRPRAPRGAGRDGPRVAGSGLLRARVHARRRGACPPALVPRRAPQRARALRGRPARGHRASW